MEVAFSARELQNAARETRLLETLRRKKKLSSEGGQTTLQSDENYVKK